ncbi:DJ-1/PfpI family protein [Plantactinospora sp. WMMB334]|uniref:DJ-1/PfpI family protein n=1 Tax=Plantactinospora sp. WMMB334 TaxID=3404119 RepID=UPI003B92BBE5
MDRRDVLRATVVAGAAAGGAAALSSGAAASPAVTPDRPLRVQVVMYDGVEEMDAIGPIEVLGLAKGMGGAITTSMVTVDGDLPITGFHGTELGPVGRWAPRGADVLLVPGGGYRRVDAPGVAYEIQRGVVPAAIAAARRRGLTLAAVCTGTMLLSAAGLTAGRPCITHHGAVEDLRAQGGVITEARVVDDGDLVTAGGITSGLDLGLWLVERFLDADLAVRIEKVLEYQRRGTVWHR